MEAKKGSPQLLTREAGVTELLSRDQPRCAGTPDASLILIWIGQELPDGARPLFTI